MRKMLFTLTTVGLLAVPAGMALAQSDTPEPAAPVTTCVDPQQDRERDRDGTADQAGTHMQDQQRNQLRTHAQIHNGDGPGAGGGTGDGAMQRRAHQGETANG